ncbi:hypothetical protein [Marinobacterium stanieri]|uniref:hypothetical protein n=1 Tax=Marinobacterium stanieri TaxID=49186 RepID=UPI003A92A35A
MPPRSESPTLFEQHAQTVLALGMVGLLGWVGYTLTNLNATVAGMAVEIQSLRDQVKELKAAASDRYTKTQADRDWAQNRREIDRIHQRLRNLEGR